MTAKTPPKALAFDVFGTVVDWRTSIAALVAQVLTAAGHADIDAFAFTDDWRMRYLIGMRDFGQTGRGFVKLDILHREMLDALLTDMQLDLAEADRHRLVMGWHRLEPWPDSVEGLNRLKRRFPLVTCSNGHIALLVNMARHAGLPWDAILGAEIAQAYKPAPRRLSAHGGGAGYRARRAMPRRRAPWRFVRRPRRRPANRLHPPPNGIWRRTGA